MFYIKGNIHTNIEGGRVDGFFELFKANNGEGYVNIEIKYPYPNLKYSLEILKDEIFLSGERLDSLETDVLSDLLSKLFFLNKYLTEHKDYINERYQFHLQSDEYEKYCIYNELKFETAQRLRKIYNSYTSGELNELPQNFQALEQQLVEYKTYTDNYRFPLFDEISNVCNIPLHNDLILQLVDKFGLPYKSDYSDIDLTSIY